MEPGKPHKPIAENAGVESIEDLDKIRFVLEAYIL